MCTHASRPPPPQQPEQRWQCQQQHRAPFEHQHQVLLPPDEPLAYEQQQLQQQVGRFSAAERQEQTRRRLRRQQDAREPLKGSDGQVWWSSWCSTACRAWMTPACQQATAALAPQEDAWPTGGALSHATHLPCGTDEQRCQQQLRGLDLSPQAGEQSGSQQQHTAAHTDQHIPQQQQQRQEVQQPQQQQSHSPHHDHPSHQHPRHQRHRRKQRPTSQHPSHHHQHRSHHHHHHHHHHFHHHQHHSHNHQPHHHHPRARPLHRLLHRLLLLLLSLALTAPSTSTSTAHAHLAYKGCPFGTLPGAWHRENPTVGQKWRLLQTDTPSKAPTPQSALAVKEVLGGNRTNCWHLEPLLARMQHYERQRFASMTTPSALEGDARAQELLDHVQQPPKWVQRPAHIYQRWHPLILLLGDHHDKWMALDTCQYVRGLKPGTMHHMPRYPDLSQGPDDDERNHRFMYFNVCENGAVSIASRYVPGVSPQGPFHKDSELVGISSSNASWPARTDETLSLFSRFFRREPDLVVLHANYWDIYRVPWQEGEHQLWLRRGLPKVFLDGWKQQMAAWVKRVRSSVPHDTLVVVRTAILPKTNAAGQPHLPQVGGALPIIQLNEAMRVVARQLKVPLLDCEMHTKDMDPRQVIRDNLSPSRWINLEWVNILLNMLAQHSPNHFGHVVQPGGAQQQHTSKHQKQQLKKRRIDRRS